MALVYATDLRLVDPVDRTAPADVDHVVDLIGRWAETADPWSLQEARGRRGGTVSVDVIRHPDGGLEGWRLQLAHADRRERDVHWNVAASITTGDHLDLAVRVDRSRVGGVRPVITTPKPPRFVRDLLSDPGILALDASTPVASTHLSVTVGRVKRFARFLLSNQRTLPVIGYTPRDDEVLDAESFFEDNIGVAHIALVQQESSWRLSKLLPDGFSVYGGAVRIWWPGIDESSVKWDHRLWTSEVSAREVYRSVADEIRKAASSRLPRDPHFAERLARQRAREIARIKEENWLYEELLSSEDSAARSGSAAEEATRRASDALEYAELAEQAMQEAEEQVEALTQRVRELTAERDHYRHQVRAKGLSEVQERTRRDATFRERLDGYIADLGREVDLRPYDLGPQFLDSLESLGPSYEDKAIRACAAIVTRLPDLLGKIDDHRLRSGDAPASPPKMRSTDGAEGRRAYLERKTPAARRLHYWVRGDGSVEFASVNLHDDMSIPE